MRVRVAALRIAAVVLLAAPLACTLCPDPRAIEWLDQDCGVGEGGRLEAELRSGGGRAERTLIDAYEHGAPSDALDEVAAEAARSYDEVISALDAGREYGLTAGEIAAIRAVSRDEHVRQAGEAYRRSYRSAALSGLAIVGLRRGRELLRRVAADPNSPDREIASVVLRHAGPPGAPP